MECTSTLRSSAGTVETCYIVHSVVLVYNDACDCVQVSRAAVEGYTGESEPPCIVMTLSSAVSDETTPPTLTLPVTLTGVRETNNILVIERRAEGNDVVEHITSDK